MKIQISSALLEASKNKLALGVLVSTVSVTQCNEDLWQSMTSFGEGMKEIYKDSSSSEITEISAVRDTYKSLGLPLSKYVGSNEALWDRARKGKGLYQINTVVDVNNLISLETLRSVGSYDLSNIGDEILFRSGTPEEVYASTKKRPLPLHKLPVLSDESGAFGSPTSDSERALIQLETKNVMTVIFSFDGQEDLSEQLERTERYLTQYAGARQVRKFVVSGSEPFFFDRPPTSPLRLSSSSPMSFFAEEKTQPSADALSPAALAQEDLNHLKLG